MNKTTALFFQLVGLLMAAHAAYWFIGGAAAAHASGRNALVVAQLLVGVALFVYGWRRHRRGRRAPAP